MQKPPLSSSKIFSSPQIKPIPLTSHSLSPLLVVVVGGLVIKSCLTLAIPWTVALQAPLSMEFPRQECWNGLPFTSPGDLPDPRIKLGSSALQADSARSPMNLSSTIKRQKNKCLLRMIWLLIDFDHRKRTCQTWIQPFLITCTLEGCK